MIDPPMLPGSRSAWRELREETGYTGNSPSSLARSIQTSLHEQHVLHRAGRRLHCLHPVEFDSAAEDIVTRLGARPTSPP